MGVGPFAAAGPADADRPGRNVCLPRDGSAASLRNGVVDFAAALPPRWPLPSEQLRFRSREEAPVDDFEIVGERFRYLTLPNPWVDKLCTGTLWAQWP